MRKPEPRQATMPTVDTDDDLERYLETVLDWDELDAERSSSCCY